MKNTSSACVYCLKDPVTQEVRYIGSTTTPLKAKLSVHLMDSKRHFHKTALWIRELALLGLKPLIEVIHDCEAHERKQLEIFYIRYLTYLGLNLTNIIFLKNNIKPKKVLSIEHRKKLSDSKIGRPVMNNRKKVHQFTLEGEFIKEWNGVIHAQKEMKCKSISVTIKKHGRAAGYLWRYV